MLTAEQGSDRGYHLILRGILSRVASPCNVTKWNYRGLLAALEGLTGKKHWYSEAMMSRTSVQP